MSKYIIELDDRIKLVTSVGVTENGVVYTTSDYVHNLEELNSDYINDHFGDLQDTAYQRGLNDAWEAARKIVCDDELDWNTLLHIFNRSNFEGIFGDFSPSEAIDKLKSYKEKQKAEDKIEVGDVVERYLNDKLDSTGIYLGEDGDYWNCLFWTGAVFGTFAYPKNQFKKTEKHVDIASILDDMRK